MTHETSTKIENSIHKKFILDCIEKGMSSQEIEKALAAKGAKITVPTIRKYMKFVRKQGVNVTQFKEQAETNALQLNEKLKNIPELTTIFSRRNFLVEQLLERRNKVLEFVNEGKPSSTLFLTLYELKELVDKYKINNDEKTFTELKNKFDFLQRFCNANFLKDGIYPKLEDTIRNYTMDIHELCKYVEQWTSKYEVEALMEKLAEMITKAAVTTFGPLLKKQNEEERKKYINKFIEEVESAVNDIKQYQLDLGEVKND